MVELPERDAALLLDMLLAARDARSFVDGLLHRTGIGVDEDESKTAIP
jgi:hypothetical protein